MAPVRVFFFCSPRVREEYLPQYLVTDSNPLHNAHVQTIEVTYPYHPQCGTRVVVYRRCKRGGQAMYDALDVHGGSTGIPAWMTESRWKELRVGDRPSVSLQILQELRALLASLHPASNEDERVHGGHGDENTQTKNACATTETEHTASNDREPQRAAAHARGTSVAGIEE